MKHVTERTIGLLGLALGGLLTASLALPAQSFAQTPSVKVADNATFGPILTDTNGMTLYTYIPDDGAGTSKCYDACATSWPPATIQGDVAAPSGLPKTLATTTRTDGTKQLTYDNWPLYRYARDTEPGQTTGDGSLGAGGLWPVAQTGAVAPTVMMSKHSRLGYILTDSKGLTLYTWEADRPKESTCYEACANAWPPVLVQDKMIVGAGLSRLLATTARNDGTTQVTYKDLPLYTFRRDMQPGDTNGEGSTGFGALWVIPTVQVVPAPAAQAAPSPAAAAPAAPAAGASQAAPKPVASPAVQVPGSLPRTGDGSTLSSTFPTIAVVAGLVGLIGLGAGFAMRRFRA
jgi:predicted lipoprotein with Yx(FWY)xxD motif